MAGVLGSPCDSFPSFPLQTLGPDEVFSLTQEGRGAEEGTLYPLSLHPSEPGADLSSLALESVQARVGHQLGHLGQPLTQL